MASEQPQITAPPGFILLSDAEYRRLLSAAEANDTLIWCEVCGAWIDHNDPAAAVTDDFRGCWKAASHEDSNLCRSWRAPDRTPGPADLEPGADLAGRAVVEGGRDGR